MIEIEESKNHIRTHARACSPYECCGLIVRNGQKQKVVCARNVAEDPRHSFFIAPEDVSAAYDVGEVLAVYHSHVAESPVATDGDRALAEMHKIPVVTYGVASDTWDVYKPTGWKPDMIGRPFVFGVLDCLTLVQDHYREKLAIEIPNFLRSPNFWKNGVDLFAEHLPKNGFVKMREIAENDVITMALDARVSNHCAVYIGDGMMLHHAPNHLSGVHPYVSDRGYYALATTGFWRHKSLIEAENSAKIGE